MDQNYLNYVSQLHTYNPASHEYLYLHDTSKIKRLRVVYIKRIAKAALKQLHSYPAVYLPFLEFLFKNSRNCFTSRIFTNNYVSNLIKLKNTQAYKDAIFTPYFGGQTRIYMSAHYQNDYNILCGIAPVQPAINNLNPLLPQQILPIPIPIPVPLANNKNNKLLDTLCSSQQPLGKILPFCKENNIIPCYDNLSSIYRNSSIRWQDVDKYIDELFSAGMIVNSEIITSIIYCKDLRENSYQNALLALFTYIDITNIPLLTSCFSYLSTTYVRQVSTHKYSDAIAFFLDFLKSRGLSSDSYDKIFDALIKNDNIAYSDIIKLHELFGKPLTDITRSLNQLCDKYCLQGNLSEITKMIANNQFVLTNKSLFNACLSGNKDLIIELISMKAIPTADCLMALKINLLTENMIDIFVVAGLKIDINIAMQLINRGITNIQFVEKYGIKTNENNYFQAHKNSQLTQTYNKMFYVWNSDLHNFRDAFKTQNINYIISLIEKTKFVPDQFCFDNAMWGCNTNVVEWLNKNFNMKPTLFTLSAYINSQISGYNYNNTKSSIVYDTLLKYKTEFTDMKVGTEEEYVNNPNHIKLTTPPPEQIKENNKETSETKSDSKDDLDYDLLEKELNDEFISFEKKVTIKDKKTPKKGPVKKSVVQKPKL
jgi:hypothetical protein